MGKPTTIRRAQSVAAEERARSRPSSSRGCRPRAFALPSVSGRAARKSLRRPENTIVGADLKWLLMITSPRSSTYVDTPTIGTPGNQMAFFLDANTFPMPLQDSISSD
jgi:hypothetical protein